MFLRRDNAFTLAELLIAIAILGVIATFTIPKVLQGQQDSKFKSVAKEAMSTISGAYQNYQRERNVDSTFGPEELLPYMNYVKRDTVTVIDNIPPSGTLNCSSAGRGCYTLHNGSVLLLVGADIGGTASTNAISFVLDPDGVTSSDKGVAFWLYYTGRVTSYGSMGGVEACNSVNCYTYPSSHDPSWFSWD